MKYSYKTSGVCSREIQIELNENGLIEDVCFIGGCSGNLKGISKLVKGKSPEEISSLLNGINCGQKGTSCPDQLAKALNQIIEKQKG